MARQHGSGRRRCAAAVALLVAAACLAQRAHASTRICLNMIAKNEKRDLPEMLPLIGPELSGWTLCDTGSTDGTPQLAQSFFDGLHVPGVVAYHEWKDFSANRNLCIKAGLEWSLAHAKETGMPEGAHFCEYLLFLDADHMFKLAPGAAPGDLKALNLTRDVYFMEERNTRIYKNIRLASTRVDWEWVGEVHEFVHRVDNTPPEQNHIEGHWLAHDATGGNTGDRFVRDEVILRKAVEERPNDPRSRFYYANTLRALKRFEEATQHYIARINLADTWVEERFMSAIQIATFAKDAYDAGDLVSRQVKEHLATWESAPWNATEEAAEEEQLQAARAALNATQAAINATREAAAAAANATGEDGKPDSSSSDVETEVSPALTEELRERKQAVDDLVAARKAREVKAVADAYWAATQLLPYRPEGWVQLAKLYRLELRNHDACYSHAVAAIAQGQPRNDALFLDANAWRYHALDEACACGYWIGARVLDQATVYCRQLQQRLTEDLAADAQEDGSQLHPGVHTMLTNMLQRVRSNIEWYEWKACTFNAGPGEDAQCKKP